MYTDIDYMGFWRDWTNDESRYPLDQWRAFVDKLRNELDRHYIVILDPGIAAPMNESDHYEVQSFYFSCVVSLANRNSDTIAHDDRTFARLMKTLRPT
jgi:hypothetical protein